MELGPVLELPELALEEVVVGAEQVLQVELALLVEVELELVVAEGEEQAWTKVLVLHL